MDEEQALLQCDVILYHSLDITVICPLLMEKKLLTPDESEVLESTLSYADKIEHLLNMLPRKGNQWWDKFINCLEETSDGTGHRKIVRELEHAKKDIESRREG